MKNDYLWDRAGEPDADIKELEDVLGTLRLRPQTFGIPEEAQPAVRRSLWPALAIAAGIALLLIAGGVWLQSRHSQAPARETAILLPSRSPSNVTSVPSGHPNFPVSPAAPMKPLHVKTAATHVAKRNVSLPHNELTAAQREEAVAAKEQVMLALRVVSAKLNLARKTIPANNNIRYQHKNG